MKKLLHLFLAGLLVAAATSCNDDEPDIAPSVNGGATFLSLDALSRSGKLSINAAAPWRVTTASGERWFTLSAQSGPAGVSEIELSLDANEGAARSAMLIFSSGDAFFRFTLSQSAAHAAFDDADYYFYASFGTLPTLYAGLHVLSHDKPSYFFYERSSTFDPAAFPSRVEVITGADGVNATDAEMDRMRTEFTRRIREINAADPRAVFGLYVDDLRCRLGYDWFVGQGIDSARVRVSMLSDGTATYNNFYNYFGDPATAEQNWDTYASQVESLDWNHGGSYPESRALIDFEAWEWPYYLSTRPGYRLILQDKSLLEPSTGFMGEKLAQMDAPSVKPYELLSSLAAPAQQQFYRMASFDYARFAALFDASPGKNLIIIGTNATVLGAEETQREYVGRIVEQYGAQYDIFFKPHPGDRSSADYGERFDLTLLPGQMPFEIFVWSLIDKIDVIGGYPSTVFLTVPISKVEFVFAPDAASLVRPLNVLFRNAEGVEWIQ